MNKESGPGRPSKLTPKVQETIVAVIRAGNYSSVAAEYAGIGRSTFYHWLELGEQQESGCYREFLDAVRGAESEAEIRAVATIQKHMPKNWQAAMAYLERKFPQRWGRRVDVTTAGDPIGTFRVTVLDAKTGVESELRLPPLGPAKPYRRDEEAPR